VKTLVIGSGFIGAYVVRNLVLQGDDVICFDPASNDGLIGELLTDAGSDASPVSIRGDVTNLRQLLDVCQRHDIDQIANLAAILPGVAEKNPPLALSVNVDGMANVCEAAVQLKLRKVAFVSTVAVYGPRSVGPEGYVTDDSPPDPRNLYGACKLLDERLARTYARQHELDVTGVRFSTVYGYGRHLMKPGSLAPWMDELMNKPARGEPSVVPRGDQIYDFQHVEDAARAITLALEYHDERGSTFLTSGDLRPVRDAFQFVKGTLLPEADMTLVDGPEPGGLPAKGVLKFRGTAAQAIGYTPQISMEEGIRRTIAKLQRTASAAPVPEPAGPAGRE
jgi:UDP-glucose 4-epimerase